jgi:hypothetical protein
MKMRLNFILFVVFSFFQSCNLFCQESVMPGLEEHTSVTIQENAPFHKNQLYDDSYEDKWYEHKPIAQDLDDPYQSFSAYKKHLSRLLQNGSYLKFACNVAFIAFGITALFIAPVWIVVYTMMHQPEKLFLDKIYERVDSLITPSSNIVKTNSTIANTISYFFENTTNLTSLVFLAAGEKMRHHQHTADYHLLVDKIKNTVDPFLKTRHGKSVLHNTATRFCFDEHDQEFKIETLASKQRITDPLVLSFDDGKACLGKEIFVVQNLGAVYRETDQNGTYYYTPFYSDLSIHEHDQYKSVYNTQRRLMQIADESSSKQDYLKTVETDFLRKRDMQSLLVMVVDSLLSHQCPSEALFDKLSTSVNGLRAPLRYIGDKYLQINLWYKEDGTVRRVLATSTNNITDRSTNHNETSPCNFASQAHLEGADARLDLDRFRYLRAITGGRDLSFTLPQTITDVLHKTFTDHFSREQTSSKTFTNQKTDTSTPDKTSSKSISILSREQYFDLLARGVWFNESDAYLNSIFPEMGGLYGPYGNGNQCLLCPSYSRSSYSVFGTLPSNKDGTNSTTFGFLYDLPNRFIFQLFGLSYGLNSNIMTKIYLGKKINTSDYFEIYTGNNPISLGAPFYYYNESIVVNNTKNASSLRIMIPHPQRDPNGDPRYFGLVYFWMKIIATDHFSREQTSSKTFTNQKTDTSTPDKTSSKSISILSREQYFNLLARGVWFNESDAYLNSIFPEMGGLYGPYDANCELCPLFARASYHATLPINSDGTNSTTFGFLYDLPNRFTFQLFGLSYGLNSNIMTKIYLGKKINTSDYFEIYTGNNPISLGAPFYYYNESVLVNNTKNASSLRIMIPHPQRDPNGDPRYFGLAYFWMKIIATDHF